MGQNTKATITAIISGFSALFGWHGWLALLFVAGMTLDIATGVTVAGVRGEWKSSTMCKGLAHKMGAVFAVAAALLFDAILVLVIGNLPGVQLPFAIPTLLGPLTMVWYTIAEFGSILENVGQLGVPVPGFLKKAIKLLHTAVDSAGEATDKQSQ